MTTVERARHWPQMPPALPGETDDAYTDRLTGADGTGRVPYDHPRNRQCSIGWHSECSDPAGERCKCPCHTETGKLEQRVHELEEALVAAWSLATAARTGTRAANIEASLGPDVDAITERWPELAEWYLSEPDGGEQDGSPCAHGPEDRCVDCATDDELAAAIPPFPAI